jgi:hypothetical protein
MFSGHHSVDDFAPVVTEISDCDGDHVLIVSRVIHARPPRR